MNISGINDQISSIKQYMLQMKEQIDSVMKDAVSQANGDNGNPLGATFEFSKPSELLSKLSQLQTSDPEKFKSLMSDIADKLQKAADEGEDTGFGTELLSDLASKFKSVAETGDLSALQPAKGGEQGPAGAGAQQEGTQAAPPQGGAGGAGGVSSTGETTTCSVCGAEISEDETVCSKCGTVVEEDENDENTGDTESATEASAFSNSADNAKIAQYLLNANEREQESLLDALAQMIENDSTESSSGSADDTMSSIRSLLTKAFQQLMQGD